MRSEKQNYIIPEIEVLVVEQDETIKTSPKCFGREYTWFTGEDDLILTE